MSSQTLSFLFITLAIALAFVRLALHSVDEGHVGVYWRGGALLERVSQPGFHFLIPILDSYAQVQVTLQTDEVINIPCGTSGGVMISIEKVEVVNRLRSDFVHGTIKNYTTSYDKVMIFDKIHHEINQWCSTHTLEEVYITHFTEVDDRLVQALQESCNQWAPGLDIIAVRITKPKIPRGIAENYEQREAKKGQLYIAIEAQKVVEKEAETERKRATIQAQKEAEVSQIRKEQEIMEKEADLRKSKIDDEMYKHHAQTLADAEFIKIERAAVANEKLHTSQFLTLEMFRALANSTKIYFGRDIQAMYHEFLAQVGTDKPKTADK